MQEASPDYAATEREFCQAHNPLPDPPARGDGEDEIADPDDPRRELDRLWTKWFPGKRPGEVVWEGVANVTEIAQILGVDFSQRVDPAAVAAFEKESLVEMGECLNGLDRSGLISQDMNGATARLILKKIESARIVVQGIMSLWSAETMQPSDFPQDDHGLWRFLPPESNAETSPGQRLKIFALTDLSRSGYRRYRSSLMERVVTEGGLQTCAWKRAMDIKEYVSGLTARRLLQPQVWLDVTAGSGWGPARNLIEYLENSRDPECPWLVPDRHTFSFENGVYLAKEEVFIPYERMSQFFSSSARLPCACKHFSLAVEPGWFAAPDPIDIPTPAFDTILDSQELSRDVKRWIYGLIGRLIYNVAEVDKWEIFIFFKGLANTGKSSILNCVRDIYEPQDIGFINNGIEKQFGLANIAEKFLGIADDVTKTFNMEQSDFQNAASGNPISCARKHKEPLIVDPWVTPIAWSGNQVPGFGDNAGSYGRRMAIAAFWKAISKPDTSLAGQLRDQMAAFIVKCNRVYRNLVRRHGHSGIWNILPREFTEQRSELSATANPLVGFLQSPAVVRGEGFYVPLSILQRNVMEFAVSCGLNKPQWCADFYKGPLVQEKLVLTRTEKRLYPRGQQRDSIPGQYVLGIDLAINCQSSS